MDPLIIGKMSEKGKDKNRSSRTTDLPEEIIVREIMSRLPTKDAIRTSLLSKTWVDKWMSRSAIELKELEPERRQQFKDFVERVLLISNPSRLDPHKFSLEFQVGDDSAMVNKWLSGFIKPDIEELTLHLEESAEPLVFPDHLFTSQKLVKFDLTMTQVLNLPSTIQLKSLKSLTLRNVIFPDGSSTQNFFCSFPFLEELTLIDCYWMNATIFCIACPLLEKLIIRESKDDDDDDDDDDDEEEEGVDEDVAPPRCKIVILGFNMKTFSYQGDLSNDYFLHDSKSIVDATVDACPQFVTWDTSYFVFKLLAALSNAEKLLMTSHLAEAVCLIPSLISNLPLFPNLIELRVHSTYPTWTNFANPALLTILRNSPQLEEIEFTRVYLNQNGEDRIAPLPICFTEHLKRIRICDFGASVGEMDALEYLLQATPVLETCNVSINMSFFRRFNMPGVINELCDVLENYPRASQGCKLELEGDALNRNIN